MTDQLSVSESIAASPQTLWEMVSDVSRMGEWSPETTSAEWVGRATSPAVGAKFRGNNRNGTKSWKTLATVVACEPGEVFEFRVDSVGLKVSLWRYTFEATDQGCLVTEHWTDRRGAIAKLFSKPLSNVEDRVAHNRAGMEQTLARLKATAEA